MLSGDFATSLLEREMDPGQRSVKYRARVAFAALPVPTLGDFDDRVTGCLRLLKREPEWDVQLSLVRCLEHIDPLPEGARAKIEGSLADLPAPAAKRLEAWLANRKQ